MNFNIEEVTINMLNAIKGTVEDNWAEVKEPATQFLNRNKERLALLVDLRLSNELSQEKFESRLEDQKLVLKAQLEALTVISKAIAQKAANAAIDILETAVKTTNKTAF